MLMSSYTRYSGIGQCHPLSEDEQKYDDTCREIDTLQERISDMRASLFTARELMWFNWFVGKVFYGSKQDQLDQQLQELRNLLTLIESRETGATKSQS